MESQVKGVISKLELIRDRLAGKMREAVHRASTIVEEGAVVVHHDIPSNSKMLPYPVGHCPFSGSPLYPPPSIERPQHLQLREVGREVRKCLLRK